MPIEFDDGSVIDANDWTQIKRILAENGRIDPDKPEPKKITEIRSRDGVTIKVGNLQLKKNPKMPLSQPNYVEGTYKDWKIRVWTQPREEIYACNYFKGQDIRYFEVSHGNVRDENCLFKLAKQYIDKIAS